MSVNWLPEMTPVEYMWFKACPKSVLFAIAQQLAMLLHAEFTAEFAFEAMQNEWSALHSNGIVPQKPFDTDKAAAKIEAYLAKRDAARDG